MKRISGVLGLFSVVFAVVMGMPANTQAVERNECSYNEESNVRGLYRADVQSLINEARERFKQRSNRYHRERRYPTKHHIEKNNVTGGQIVKPIEPKKEEPIKEKVQKIIQEEPRVVPPPVKQPVEEIEEVVEKKVVEEEKETAPQSSLYDDDFAEELAYEIHRLTNIERNRAGLPSLSWDDGLARIAIGHSGDMINRDYFDHTAPGGPGFGSCDLTCRFDRAGYQAWAWGENIAYIGTSYPENLAARFMEGWMNSPGHRRNILSENYTHEGVGVVVVGRYHFATANFARPR